MLIAILSYFMCIFAKCSDLFYLSVKEDDKEFVYRGYVPDWIGLDENNFGDYVQFHFCLHCSTIQRDFNVTKDQIIKLVEHIDLLGEDDFIERLNGIREHLTSQKTTTERQSKLVEQVIDLIDGFVEKNNKVKKWSYE